MRVVARRRPVLLDGLAHQLVVGGRVISLAVRLDRVPLEDQDNPARILNRAKDLGAPAPWQSGFAPLLLIALDVLVPSLGIDGLDDHVRDHSSPPRVTLYRAISQAVPGTRLPRTRSR